MSEQPPFPVLHVHLGPAPPAGVTGPGELMRGLRGRDGIRQSAVLTTVPTSPEGEPPIPADRIRTAGAAQDAGFLLAGLRSGGTLPAVGRALAELVGDAAGGRRAVQWPVPERWPVVHAHGAPALRAVWLAAAWRGRNPGLLATPLTGDGAVPAGLWRKAELVAAPHREGHAALARQGVERRRLRTVRAGDAGGHLRLYRRLAAGERRRVQRVDWSLARPRDRPTPGDGGRR